MKLNKYIGLAALAVAFSACQDDLLEDNKQQGGIYTLSGKMIGGAAMSRAQIDLDNTDKNAGEIFYWNEGDKFSLYQGDNDDYTEHVFSITDYSEEGENKNNTASFATNNPALPGEIIAVYPSGLRMVYDQGIMHVEIDFQTELDFSQGTVEEVWKEYFKNNMVMKAKATLSDEGNNSLSFEHLTSLARITYTNHSGKDQQVTDIEFGGDQTFGALMSVWFKYDIIGGGFNNGYKINYKNLIVRDGESFDFYILFGPADFGNGDMHIHIHTAQTDGNRSPLVLPTSTIAAANNNATKFEAGKRYWFKVTENEKGLNWTKNVTSGPTIEDVAKNGGTFTLTQDIRLTSPLVVEKDMTIDLGSEYNIGAISNGFSDPEELQTLIAVKPGATLTVTANGMNGQINTGESEIQRSAIRLIKGDDNSSGNKARLIVNGGWIVARYYGILVDKDCPDSEIIINTNDRIQGDFRKEANGTAILNLNNNGKVVVEKGTVIGNASAIEMRGGTLEVKNGTLTSEYTGETTNRSNEDGNTVIGSAVAISPISGNSVSVTINGGQFNSNSTYSLYQIYMGGKPENATVNMSVIGGTFEKDITSENCKNFISGGRYKVQPNANYMVNGKIAVSTGDYYEIQDGEPSSDLITIQNAELSTALQAVLGAENVKLENGYAVMTKEFVESVETIEIPSGQYTITSLSGIENFINLKRLECARTGLTECNLSKNTKLESVAVWGNSLTTLDLSNQASLFDINCAQNETLQTLNINANVRLKYLIIDDTNLQSLVIPNPETIWQLAYSRTPLNLDLSKFTGLEILFCSGNKLTTINLNLKTKQKLTNLECDSNSLTSLDLKEYPNLERLICWQNLLETLDITPLNNLRDLVCGNQQNDIVLQLQLTDDQKTKWESTWSTNRNNNNVRTPEDSIVEPNNGNTNGNNFWFEEL